MAQETVLISNVSHDSYYLYATVNGVGVNFFIDTGAAVSLLHTSVWRQLRTVPLDTWTGTRLVGVDGSALQVSWWSQDQSHLGKNIFSVLRRSNGRTHHRGDSGDRLPSATCSASLIFLGKQ